MKRLLPLIVLAVVLLTAYLLWHKRPEPAVNERLAATGTATAPAAGSRSATLAPASPEPRSTLADELNLPSGDIHADLRIVATILDTFRSNFPRDGNPTGTNAEITAALTGRNRLQLSLIPPDHPAIDAGGELCDRWGTPFFFHAESGTRMEIHSAGPDRRLHTSDDIVQLP